MRAEGKGISMVQEKEIPAIEREVNGCHITLLFSKKPVEGTLDKVKSILSNAYDERMQNDLMKTASLK